MHQTFSSMQNVSSDTCIVLWTATKTNKLEVSRVAERKQKLNVSQFYFSHKEYGTVIRAKGKQSNENLTIRSRLSAVIKSQIETQLCSDVNKLTPQLNYTSHAISFILLPSTYKHVRRSRHILYWPRIKAMTTNLWIYQQSRLYRGIKTSSAPVSFSAQYKIPANIFDYFFTFLPRTNCWRNINILSRILHKISAINWPSAIVVSLSSLREWNNYWKHECNYPTRINKNRARKNLKQL